MLQLPLDLLVKLDGERNSTWDSRVGRVKVDAGRTEAAALVRFSILAGDRIETRDIERRQCTAVQRFP